MKKIILSAALLASLNAIAADAPLWLRDAVISPDGSRIAFTYKGDIFTVPVDGGDALRLTSQPGYETSPIWSPDGKTIAFAADRYGNFDIFTVAADGSSSEWKRLTFNSTSEIPEAFTPDGKAVLYSAAIQDPASSSQFPSKRLTELYSVPVNGGASSQVLSTPATAISWAPDGKSFLYQDVKSFEDTWRKHHTSSVTRNIWRYTPATGKHEQIIDFAAENLSPVQDGEYIYFLSERAPSKSINVYRAPVSNPAAAERITDFRTHPVRFLSRANNGTMAFTYDGEIYTMRNGAKPAKVKIAVKGDFPDEVRKLTATSGAREATASPNGKNVAFIYRGDVYVTPVDYATTKQISNTPEAESDLSWGNDTTLYYTSERDGLYNIYSATLAIAGEPDLAHATIIKEEPVFKADKHERTAAQLSPDGKNLAFILDRNKLAVMDMKSGKVKELTDGSTHRQRGGRFNFTWSPDSRWIALEIIDRRHDPYSDIAIINVENGSLTNITNSGYFDSDPRWTMDGNAISFISERYGMRNHASWGSMSDVLLVFLNQDAFTDFKKSKEERELAKQDDKKDKKDADKKDKKDKKGDDKEKAKADDDKAIKVELDGISDRIVRLTPMSTDLVDAIINPKDRVLHFVSNADDGDAFLWEYDMDKEELQLKKRTQPGRFEMPPDGKNTFYYGRTLSKFGGKPISYRAVKKLDPAAERRFMFDNAEREERERFYTKDMHGVDWKAMSDAYRKFLPHINNNYDFAELLSEWLGELNVSHTGGRYSGTPGAPAAENTASLGVLFDMSYTGKGAKIEEILAQGPLYGLNPSIEPGNIITAVNGEEITHEQPLDVLLADAAGKRTLLSIKDNAGKERNITVRPISGGAMSGLLYTRWVKNRAADVERLSNGRLGYVHIASMDDASFRKVYSDLLGKYNDREGVVIDIRWNGGGRLHEDIEVLLSGQKYFTQEVRGEATCDMPSRRWNKPSIMVMSEACYSNAHGTPWVYSHRGLGKLVGMPVAGTMTSVNWVRMQDPSLIFGIPVVGYRLADGGVLENRQLEPDFKVMNTPEEVAAGEDAQLRVAVEELLKQIDRTKKK
ncbi:MAG: PDZ domain-containing protein [Muribaculaceae bacterium]|nr:PDZ domain-containing protein [Muribaculaceae bacterium]